MSVINYSYFNGKTEGYQITTFKGSSSAEITSAKAQAEADAELLEQIKAEVGTDWSCGSCSSASSSSCGSTSSTSSAQNTVNPQSTEWHFLTSVGSASSICSVGDLSVSTIINMYITGNMTVDEVTKGLYAHDIKYSSAWGRINFSYNGKVYNLYCNSDASKSQIDNITVDVYTEKSLKNTYKLTDKLITCFFDEVESVYDEKTGKYEKKYTLSSLCKKVGIKKVSDFKSLYDKYLQDLIRNNYLANVNLKSDNSEDLSKFGKLQLSMDTFYEYLEYNLGIIPKGNELTNEKQAVLDKFLKDFVEGNLSINQVDAILKSIGAYSITTRTADTEITVCFKYQNKDYTVGCNKADAQKGTDKSMSYVFTVPEIKKLGLPQDVIEKYFYVSTKIGYTVTSYSLRADYSIEDVKNYIKENGCDTTGTNSITNVDGYLIALKKDILKKYNISEGFYNSVADFVSNQNLNRYKTIENMIEKLCSPPQEDEFNYTARDRDGLLVEKNIYTDGFNIDVWYKADNIYMSYLNSIIDDVCQKYGIELRQRKAFLIRVLYNFSDNPDPFRFAGKSNVSGGTLKHLSSDNGTWLDKFTQAVIEEAEKLAGIDYSDEGLTSKIDLDKLFEQWGTDNIVGCTNDYYKLFDLTLSSDPGVRRFATELLDGIEKWVQNTSGNNYKLSEDEQNYTVFRAIIANMNYRASVEPSKVDYSINTMLSKSTLEKFARNGKLFSKLNEVLDESNVAILSLATINGEFDSACGQGNIGDCWAISGLLSLNATSEGQYWLRSLITRRADGSVIVKIPGADKMYTISAREIANADINASGQSSQYSCGDNDMLVWELAIEKLRLDLGHGNINGIGTNDPHDAPLKGGDTDELFGYIFGHKAYANASGGEYFWSALFGTDVIAMKNSTVLKVLSDVWNKIIKNNPAGINPDNYFYYGGQAITFSLGSITGDHDFTMTDIYGKVFEYKHKEKFFGGGGHIFYVTNMTATTITFSNSWAIEGTGKGAQHIEYTFTWEQFAELGIWDIAYTDLSWINNQSYYDSTGRWSV